MRALALLLGLMSTQAWGAADTYVRAPWRAVTWIHAPDLMWVVGVTIALIAVWIVRLLSGDRDERRLGSLLAVFLLAGVSFNAKLAGTIFYVRPAADCANNGDGTAYSCAASGGAAGAWRTMANVVWGVSGVNTGDTLRPCSSEASPFAVADYDGGGLAMLSVDQSGATVDGDCSAAGGSTLATFTGDDLRDYGLYCHDNTTCPNQTWRNISVSHFELRGFYVRNGATATNALAFTGDNLSCADILGGANAHCFTSYGTGASWSNLNGVRTSDDTQYFEGDDFSLQTAEFIYPAYLSATNLGDCLQGQTQTDNARISGLRCDHRNAATKQCIIITAGAGDDNALIEDSVCLFPTTGNSTNLTKGIYSDIPNTRFLRNYVQGAYYGIYVLGAGASVVGNILVGQELRGVDAVSTVASGTHLIAHNSVSGATTGIVLNGGASVTNDVYNNLVMNATTGYNKSGSSTLNQDYNAAYSNTTNSSGAGTIDFTSDPMLIGGASPTTAEGFCLTPDSPLLAAGTYLGAWATGYAGQDLGKPPAIGARGLCVGRARTPTRAAAAGRAQ